jgi:hypothetical protein
MTRPLTLLIPEMPVLALHPVLQGGMTLFGDGIDTVNSDNFYRTSY